MKMVKLIIEVADELLEHIDEPCNDEDLLRYIIKHGTPLPEHHSDLIERDALLDNVKDYGEGQNKLMLIDPYYVRRAETIIPATGNEFFNFDAPIIKKQTATKEGDGE